MNRLYIYVRIIIIIINIVFISFSLFSRRADDEFIVHI